MKERVTSIFESIPSRGIPPYTVFSATLKFIRAHPTHVSTFSEVLKTIFDLTDAGTDIDGPNVVRKEYAIDSTGSIIFDIAVKKDVQILLDIDKLK